MVTTASNLQEFEPPSFDELYARIEALPEGITGEILPPGLLRTMSRPGRAHRLAATWCGDSLRERNRNLLGTGWWIEVEAEIRLLKDRLVVPDMSGWRVERVTELPDQNPIAIVPDWCCEVLSPNTQRVDRVIKTPLYVKAGVEWIWLVDPMAHTFEVFQVIEGRAVLALSAGADDTITPPPFDSEITLKDWWLSEGDSSPSSPAP
jgi:Uma2 family endonuclease